MTFLCFIINKHAVAVYHPEIIKTWAHGKGALTGYRYPPNSFAIR